MKRILFGLITAIFMGSVTTTSVHAKIHHKPQHQSEDRDVSDDPSADQVMKKLTNAPGVVKLPDGLSYKIIESGSSDEESPQKGDIVMVVYEGRLPDGSIFDESDRHGNGAYMQMPLQDLIEGWMRILPRMRPGDKWEIYVPPQLGYGHKTMGIIPADSPLIFRIELLGVEHARNTF